MKNASDNAKWTLKENSISFLEEETLSKHSSFKIGGPCDLYVIPEDQQQFKLTLDTLQTSGMKFYILGNGSNVLFDDLGYRGAVISTEMLNGCFVDEETSDAYFLYVDCGLSLTKLSLFALKNSLTGMEFAYGIPGSIGGAVYMNAGAYGGEISQVLVSSLIYDISNHKVFELQSKDHLFGYRDSVFRQNRDLIHLQSCFKLDHGDVDDIKKKMEDLFSRRREKQPLEFPSAGSTFKRPEGHFAGALIEGCGLKGSCVGKAQVSEKHAGFIINRGGATSADVLALIEHVKTTVLKEYGVELECEVIYVSP